MDKRIEKPKQRRRSFINNGLERFRSQPRIQTAKIFDQNSEEEN